MRRISLFMVPAAIVGIASMAHTQSLSDLLPADCSLVQGVIEASFTSETTLEGTVSGDLEGTLDTTVVDSVVIDDAIEVLFAESTITTADGSIETTDTIALVSLGPVMDLWFGRHEITGGTGDFEGAFGGLKTFGLQFNGGPLNLQYFGAVCTD
ncbi:MAG: hypothetical protein IH830_08060 [Planctomycetes bacterium]|nr:hypothetical protein [Planctomycetota bacterium]